MSVLNHMDWPPTARERGNLPARIHAQRVGNVTLVMASTSRFESSRAPNRAGGARAARTLRSSCSRAGRFAAARASSASLLVPLDQVGRNVAGLRFAALASAAFFAKATCAAGGLERVSSVFVATRESKGIAFNSR